MKIAVTADVHLTTREEHPERYHALIQILESLGDQKIDQLIIAGDLFDKDVQNYSDFEAICKRFPQIKVHVIPGNHDPSVEQKRFVVNNICAYNTPTAVTFDETTFLFVPYKLDTTMGESIAPEEDRLEKGKWILVGHGDYAGGIRRTNADEPGTYMPLFRSEIERYQPRAVLLGHIHICFNKGNVYYPGSPCGLDISETGRRYYLTYDTETGSIARQKIETDILYLQESFLVLPGDDEIPRLENEIKQRINSWNLRDSEHERVCLRIEARGFCSDRQAIFDLLDLHFSRFNYHKETPPNVDNLAISDNEKLVHIAQQVEQQINALQWPQNREGDPEIDEIILAALQVIYGDGNS